MPDFSLLTLHAFGLQPAATRLPAQHGRQVVVLEGGAHAIHLGRLDSQGSGDVAPFFQGGRDPPGYLSGFVVSNPEVFSKYACPRCKGTEEPFRPTEAIAPPPARIIPKALAAPGLSAHVPATRFVDAVPFYRQEAEFLRLGVEIKRATMYWALKVAGACEPSVELLREEVLAGPIVGCDETRQRVLDKPGREPTAESYMWVSVGGQRELRCVVFYYSPSPGGEVAAPFLKGYEGGVQADGHSGYNFLDKTPGIIHCGCWAHARRGFTDVLKAVQKAGRKPIGGLAQEAVDPMRIHFAIDASERDRGLSAEEVLAVRQAESKPQAAVIKAWLDAKLIEVPPQSLPGKAVSYSVSQWPRLLACFDNGFVRLDTNEVKNMIRPFALGRKNWLSSAAPDGACASATHYSLIQTARANRIEPYRYLRYLFERLPVATTREERKVLLPPFIPRDWPGAPRSTTPENNLAAQ